MALLVGDFVCRSGRRRQDADPRVRDARQTRADGVRPDRRRAAGAFFNNYFGIPYPYEKLDIIGVPDFAAGAMENAGAITFRERMLLADRKTASAGVAKSVASVISHELAHQWFGDLVTMKWWDDIWLNEGFATWAANKPLAAWKPEWPWTSTPPPKRRWRSGSMRCDRRAPFAPRSRRRPRSTRFRSDRV